MNRPTEQDLAAAVVLPLSGMAAAICLAIGIATPDNRLTLAGLALAFVALTALHVAKSPD